MGNKILVGVGYCSKDDEARFEADDAWRMRVFAQLTPYVSVERLHAESPLPLSEPKRLCGCILFADASCARDPLTAMLRCQMPWLPVEENAHLLHDEALQESFVERVFALYELNELWRKGLTRSGLIAFHSRYKLVLLAHSQPAYRELGPFVAGIDAWRDLTAFAVEYRRRLMSLLSQRATRANHTNVLMHVQGYFRRYLSSPQRQELADEIARYRQGELPLAEPIAHLKRYLNEYPDAYLSQQRYFVSYSQEMSLRYGG
ncbi:YbgA family protein [Leminorella grimontii]|uniref:YbgA family protein n=1 Tax=Leminorella grimontii TaxID=82981 RepID=UPI002084FA03|nr:hypothetical protein SOASR031_19880 [Leminorella grimontii]